MNVNKILPVLFKAVQVKTGQQQPGNKNIERPEVKPSLLPATTKGSSLDKPTVTTKPQGSGLLEITYLPLPLKSEHFRNALFFVRHFSGKQQGQKEENSGFFIKLDTNNLGILWIGLETVNNKGLIVRVVTEREEYQQAIKSILPGIRQDLEGLDYGSIVTSCVVQPNVRHCQDIDPEAHGLTVVTSMMDWQV